MAYLATGSDISFVRIHNSDMMMQVDLALEQERASKFMPLIMKHGRGFEPHQRRFDYATFSPMNPKDRCFDNAVTTARRYNLKYFEGLVLCEADMGPLVGYKLLPLAHAWCVDGHGALVDPTLHKHQHCSSLMYIGLPIKLGYVSSWHAQVGYYGCLDGDRYDLPIGVHHDDPSLWLDL